MINLGLLFSLGIVHVIWMKHYQVLVIHYIEDVKLKPEVEIHVKLGASRFLMFTLEVVTLPKELMELIIIVEIQTENLQYGATK